MTRTAWLAALLSIGVLCAATPADRPVPLGAEPAHHLALTTTQVRMYRVQVEPHAATLLHQHERDYLWVALGDVDITNAVLGKPEARIKADDASLHYARGGFAHVARNESARPFRNLTIELLKPQTGARNLCDPVLAGASTDCPAAVDAPGGQGRTPALRPEFDTDQTRASLLSLDPKATWTCTPSTTPLLLLALDGAEAEALVRLNVPGGSTARGARPLRSADYLECSAGMAVEIRNLGSAPARFLVLEFKQD